jgi:phenylpropionate dioxygenase-like ring-hydroxylating dioxygenase large terminal subunit
LYINFWYPLATSDELTDSVIKVRCLGHDFALFRDHTGAFRCLADTCPHRGGSLGMGLLEDGLVQCPYHGWRFDGAGQCLRIPTLPADQKIPARARVDSYPVQERYGLIFAFLGDLPESDRPPLMEIDEWGQGDWSVTSIVYDWQANFERVIENGLDATHTEFVHPSAGLQGSFNPSDHGDGELVELSWGSAFRSKATGVEIEHGHLGPVNQWTFLTFNSAGFSGRFKFYSFVRPIDQNSVRRYLFHARNFQPGEAMDKELIDTTLGFEAEDRIVIEHMRPHYSPRDGGGELLLPEDEIMLRYRRWLLEWDNKGWRIDHHAIAEESSRRIFAVPCPGRRKKKNWVRAPVPLLGNGH